jgi:uncharacterized protein YqeY
MLKQKLQEELRQSVLARNALKTSVLRMLISAVGYYEIQKGGAGYEATDEDVLTVINKEAKQRKDSIEQFKAGNRQDLADKETHELEILQGYLPVQMPEEEIRKLVEEAVTQTNAHSMQDMGKVMGALMPKVKGKADGGLVSSIVKEKLQ